MTPVLQHIPIAAIRNVWPQVRDRMQAIADRDGEPWIAEDVFHEILVGNSYLWATEDLDAFVVLQVQATGFNRDLHIWIGCENSLAHAADYWPQLHEIAREANCGRITFETSRRWERALPNLHCRRLYIASVA